MPAKWGIEVKLANVRRRCRQMFFTLVVVNYQRREAKGQTMIYKALHRKQLIGQHVYVYPRENEVVFLCEFRYLKRTESETSAEYVKSLIKCQTINKFLSKQIPFIEKGTRWHYNCCNHSTRPFTPEHESGTATSSSLSKATTASIINILSEWFWYPKHRSMSRWNYWQALGKMLTTFPFQQG